MRIFRYWLAFVVATAPVYAPFAAEPSPIQASQDLAYPGTIRLHVDATNIDQRIFTVRETIPVAGAGPLTLMFPQWLPGQHAPRGPIEKLGGLVVSAGGQRLAWRRDPHQVFAFHIDVPAGVAAVDVDFQYLTPLTRDQGRVVVTPEMLNLQWNAVALYPAGYRVDRIPVEATLRLPTGWTAATALESANVSDGVTTFKPVSFDTLVDSPVFAGKHTTRIELDPEGRSRVTLNIVADEPSLLEAKPEHVEAHRALVKQADKLFGARHFDHYDLLLALSERMGGIGLEHHRSSENAPGAKYFTEWDRQWAGRDLLPHEYAHSWNGKFRRPADLLTPDFHTPMQGSLLWVYEGQTQYWGYVLAARSGLWSKQQALDAIAATAASYDHRVGRAWKNLQDTTNDPLVMQRRSQPWGSWQRSEDYYSEGLLLWLDVDTLLRERSRGRRSLDDFARAFFGIGDGQWENPLPYTFEDLVAVLTNVDSYDWGTLLRRRLDGNGPGAPLDGLARGGYRLVYSEEPTELNKHYETQRRTLDLTFSLGATIREEGELSGVLWDGPLFKAGLSSGARIVGVNGLIYETERMKQAVKATKTGGKLELIVRVGDELRTVNLDYKDGLRYPRLERIEGVPARLDDILAARR